MDFYLAYDKNRLELFVTQSKIKEKLEEVKQLNQLKENWKIFKAQGKKNRAEYQKLSKRLKSRHDAAEAKKICKGFLKSTVTPAKLASVASSPVKV